MFWCTGLIYLFVVIFTNTGLFAEGEGPINKECLHNSKKRKLSECKKCAFVAETNEERENHVCKVNHFFIILLVTLKPHRL